jgi:hypothetical protein
LPRRLLAPARHAGRPLAVMAGAPGGSVRVLDIEPATIPTAFLEGLDDFDRAQAHAFNRGAYPSGGPQWDPVTRTLWCWGEPAEGPPRTEEGEKVAAKVTRPAVVTAGPPGAAPAEAAGSANPAPEPPPALPAPARPAVAETAARPDTTATPLEARVRRLLEGAAAPADPADADLAEAVCALRWPNWPPYRGPLDLAAVRQALHGRLIDERTLTRLGGSAFAKPAAVPVPERPPPRPPPRQPPPDEPQPRRRPKPATRRRTAGDGGRGPPP